MIKRLVCVLTLLVASSVSGQEINSDSVTSSSIGNTFERPVVTVVSATGSVDTTLNNASDQSTSTLAAEVLVDNGFGTSSTSTVIENGAFGTSSTSTVSTTTETTEVEDTQSQDEEQLFAVVYQGFEEFVEKFFGWE